MKLLQVLTCVAAVLSTLSVRAEIVILEPLFDEVGFRLHGDVDHQGITFVSHDGNVLFDDPTAQGLGLDVPLLLTVGNLNEFTLEVRSGATDIPIGNCCILVEWDPASQLLIDGELVNPPSSLFNPPPISARRVSIGQQLSIRSEVPEESILPSSTPGTFFQTLFRVDGDSLEYVDGFDVTVAPSGVAITDIATIDTPGEYLLTSFVDGSTSDMYERIIVVPEPSGISLLFGCCSALQGGEGRLQSAADYPVNVCAFDE